MKDELFPEITEFRAEIRNWLCANVPPDISEKVRRCGYLDSAPLSKSDYTRWQSILHSRGWGAPGWPQEYGGPGWSDLQRYVFDCETALADCPQQLPHGLSMVAPVIYTFGSSTQKVRFLPRIASGEDWWCQGFSEPGAGSDLAALKTTARKFGAVYVLNGQKTWTSFAQHANWMFCLARTSFTGKPQDGISFFLVDMSSPGIEVRPIKTIDGGTSVNEVFLSDVAVPRENLVGDEGKGWTYAKFLLGHERSAISGVGRALRRASQIREIAVAMDPGTSDIQVCLSRLDEIEIDLIALEELQLRFLLDRKSGNSLANAAMLKIRGTELHQQLGEIALDTIGAAALPYGKSTDLEPPHDLPWFARGDQMTWHIYAKALSIYGGSNEIQRSIIASELLGR